MRPSDTPRVRCEYQGGIVLRWPQSRKSSKVENFKKSKKNHTYVFFKTENRVRQLTTSSTTHGVGKKLSLYEFFQKSGVFSQESTPPNICKNLKMINSHHWRPLATYWRPPGVQLATWRPGDHWQPTVPNGFQCMSMVPPALTGDPGYPRHTHTRDSQRQRQ